MSDRQVAVSFPLSRPLQAHGEQIRQLDFREPTGADAFACGMPFRMGPDDQIIVSMPETMGLAARLASVPLSTIKAMPMADLMGVVKIILGFMGMSQTTQDQEPAETLSADASTSPGSGAATPIPFSRSG